MAEILFLLFLAIIGGAALGVNRSLLGIIGKSDGAVQASIVNHISGVLFLILTLLLLQEGISLDDLKAAPLYSHLGGVIGALFVAITSYVIPKIGVLKTSIFLISGQITCGTLLDYFHGNLDSIPKSILGLFLIIMGISIGFIKDYKKSR